MEYEFSDHGTLSRLEDGCLDAVVFRRYTLPMPEDLAMILHEQARFMLQGGSSGSAIHAAMSRLDLDVLEMIAQDGYAPLKKDDPLTQEYLRNAGRRTVHGSAVRIPGFTTILALGRGPILKEQYRIGDLFYPEGGTVHVAWLSDKYVDHARFYAAFMHERFSRPDAVDALQEMPCLGMYVGAVLEAYTPRRLIS